MKRPEIPFGESVRPQTMYPSLPAKAGTTGGEQTHRGAARTGYRLLPGRDAPNNLPDAGHQPRHSRPSPPSVPTAGTAARSLTQTHTRCPRGSRELPRKKLLLAEASASEPLLFIASPSSVRRCPGEGRHSRGPLATPARAARGAPSRARCRGRARRCGACAGGGGGTL